MKLKQSDKRSTPYDSETERAVSPVIGVILMVAITVILAAVIGVFVLGLGDELGDGAAPTTTLGFSDGDNDETDGYNFEINHQQGDSIDLAEVSVLINGSDDTEELQAGLEGELSAGESAQIGEIDEDGDGLEVLSGVPTDAVDEGEVEVEITIRHDPSDSIIADGTVVLVERETGT